jgi:hypothetical protein
MSRSTKSSDKRGQSSPTSSELTPATGTQHMLYLPPELRLRVYQYLTEDTPEYRPEAEQAPEYHNVFIRNQNRYRAFWSACRIFSSVLFRVCHQLSAELKDFERTYKSNHPPVLFVEYRRLKEVSELAELVSTARGCDAPWLAKQNKDPVLTPLFGPLALEMPWRQHKKVIKRYLWSDQYTPGQYDAVMAKHKACFLAFLKETLLGLRHTNIMELYVIIKPTFRMRKELHRGNNLRKLIDGLYGAFMRCTHGVHYRVTVLLAEHDEYVENHVEDVGLKMRIATNQELSFFEDDVLDRVRTYISA